MATPSSPAADNDPKRAWSALVARVKVGEAALGKRLYLLGAGPVPVEGAAGGAVTLDAGGGIVLVVGLAEASEAAGAQIARQVAAVAGLPGAKLREAGIDPDAGGGLAARHAVYFDLSEPVELNSGQRCIVVLPAPPDDDRRAALEGALGASMGGIFVATDEAVTPLEAPLPVEEEIVLEPETPVDEAPAEDVEPPVEEAPAEVEEAAEPEPEAAVAEPAEETAPEVDELEVPEADEAEPEGPASIEAALDAGTPEETTTGEAVTEEPTAEDVDAGVTTIDEEAAPDLVAPYLEDESTTVIAEEADAVAAERTGIAAWPIGNWIGLTMVLLGIVLGVYGVINLKGDPPPQPKINEDIRTVASGVTPDATHARWIGQQRVVTLSDGTLVFVYPTATSVNLVEDGAGSGASWDEPFVLEDVAGAASLSVDVDSKDRLHVVYSDGVSVNYVRLKNKPAGWKPSRLIQIDDDTTSLHVDVAWDEQNQTAHVVWVQQSDEGEAPAWAALTSEGGIQMAEPGILADPGENPVLVSVAADGRSSLLITYRRGDQTSGWSSRYSPGRSTEGEWLFNEEEQVPISSFVGAVDVVYDRQRTAHLVLRDSDAFNISYFTKSGGEPWVDGGIAAQGETVEDVDFPTLSYNGGEGNLYLFFQTEEFDPAGEISYMVHPLGGTGWQGPFDITNPADAPEGALYPVAPDRVDVQTVVFWTKTGEPYEIDSAPVVAPAPQ